MATSIACGNTCDGNCVAVGGAWKTTRNSGRYLRLAKAQEEVALMFRRSLFGLVALASVAVLGTSPAAVAYPDKPVQLIAPYGPGGASDLAARTLASSVPAYLGNAMIVTNRTGAAGVVGSTFVAKSKPDGYTPVSYTHLRAHET